MPITTTTEANVGTPGHTIQPEGEPPVRVQRVVSLGDLYAGSCAICGKRGEWGIANQSGPEGCVEATQTGRIFCLEHLDDQRPAKANKD